MTENRSDNPGAQPPARDHISPQGQKQASAPVYPPQVFQGPAPSGGAKAGYFALGFFLMLIGVLISWLITKDKGPAFKSAGLKLSLIGFVVGFVAWMLLGALATCSIMSLYAYL